MKLLKAVDQLVTEELLQQVTGKLIYVPVNKHYVIYEDDIKKVELNDTEPNVKEENAWFAGEVGGYRKSCILYDYYNDVYLDNPIEEFSIICVDEIEYVLGLCELFEITREEYDELASKCSNNEGYDPNQSGV